MTTQLAAALTAALAPLLSLVYAAGDHFGWWDHLTGRKHALEGLERMRSGSGFPKGWIYNDEQDAMTFAALERRIRRNTQNPKLRSALKEGHQPSLISVGGAAIPLHGVPDEWPQEERVVYLPDHPVLLAFGVDRGSQQSKGKIGKACTLGELEDWLAHERSSRQFRVGTVALGVLAVAITLASRVLATTTSQN